MRADALDYNAEVRHRFDTLPCHGRVLADAAERLAGAAGEAVQGVRVEFEARVKLGRVVECRFSAYGCPHVIAAASWVAEHAEGRPVGEVDWVDARRLEAQLNVPPHKLGRLLVVEDAIRACLGGVTP